MAIYCRKCGQENRLPILAVRTANEPCDFCHGFEQGTTRRTVGRPGNRRRVEENVRLRNFEYPDKLLGDAASLNDGVPTHHTPGVHIGH